MKLRYSARALQLIDEALGYVTERSPVEAAKIAGCITAILTLLQSQPHAGGRTRLSGGVGSSSPPSLISSTTMSGRTKSSRFGSGIVFPLCSVLRRHPERILSRPHKSIPQWGLRWS